jgi:Ca2+-transporting ATPase
VGGLVIGNALQIAVIYLPVLNDVFHTVPIPPREAFAIGAVASLVLWTEELRKWIARRVAAADPPPVAAGELGRTGAGS